MLKGEIISYETEFDFEKVKKLKLYRTSKSGTIHIRVIITPLVMKGKKATEGYLVQIEDITERKNMEKSLRESKKRLDTIYESVGEGI